MGLLMTHVLSELCSYKTGISPDCQYPGGGDKYLSSGKISGHYLWFSAVGPTFLQLAA